MKFLNVPLNDTVLKALDEDAKARQIQKKRIVEDILMTHYKIKRNKTKKG